MTHQISPSEKLVLNVLPDPPLDGQGLELGREVLYEELVLLLEDALADHLLRVVVLLEVLLPEIVLRAAQRNRGLAAAGLQDRALGTQDLLFLLADGLLQLLFFG
jgi:hypothetical protein